MSHAVFGNGSRAAITLGPTRVRLIPASRPTDGACSLRQRANSRFTSCAGRGGADPRAKLVHFLGGRSQAPLAEDIRQRLKYSRRTFDTGNRSCAFDGGDQCGCAGGCARGSETAPPEMLCNNSGQLDKSACDPFGQLSVQHGHLTHQILHETSILEVGGNHFGRDCRKNLIKKIRSIACRTR